MGRTDAEAEAPVIWPPDVKRQLIRKDPHQMIKKKKKEKTLVLGKIEDEIRQQ